MASNVLKFVLDDRVIVVLSMIPNDVDVHLVRWRRAGVQDFREGEGCPTAPLVKGAAEVITVSLRVP